MTEVSLDLHLVYSLPNETFVVVDVVDTGEKQRNITPIMKNDAKRKNVYDA